MFDPWGSMARGVLLPLLVLLFALSACSEPPFYGPPHGWVAAGTRWWNAEVDTAGLFRPLETFSDMDVDERIVVFGAGRLTLQAQMASAVQGRLLQLYRTEPAVVDSLFDRYVVPRIAKEVRPGADQEREVERLLRDSYRVIARHYQEPRALSRIGVDIPLTPRPDSLVALSGTVRMQLSIDSLGRTTTIEMLEGVHPLLNAIAMQSTAQMKWRPAYLHGKPIRSWARFRLSFEGNP